MGVLVVLSPPHAKCPIIRVSLILSTSFGSEVVYMRIRTILVADADVQVELGGDVIAIRLDDTGVKYVSVLDTDAGELGGEVEVRHDEGWRWSVVVRLEEALSCWLLRTEMRMPPQHHKTRRLLPSLYIRELSPSQAKTWL
jgi:hypothetical protein